MGGHPAHGLEKKLRIQRISAQKLGTRDTEHLRMERLGSQLETKPGDRYNK